MFGEVALGLGLLAVACLAFAWIARSFRSEPDAPAAIPDRTPMAAD